MAATETQRAGDSPNLRARAEARVQAREGPRGDLSELGEADVRRLAYELEVHREELELQREELRETQLALQRREQAIERARAQLEAPRDERGRLYDAARIGYLTFDGDARIGEVNETLAELLGVEPDVLVGADLARFIMPESQDEFAYYRRDLAAGEERRTRELRLRFGEDGFLWGRLEAQPDVDSATGRALYRATLRDVSARREAEAQLRLQVRLTERISACAGVAIFITDLRSRIVRVNSEVERVFGYSGAELIGWPLHERLHGQAAFAAAGRGEDCPLCRPPSPDAELRDYETRLLRKNGEPLDARCSKTRLESDGEPFGGLLVVQDISLRRRAERELESASRRSEAFLATLAHELRNPLAPISSALGVLQLTPAPDERTRAAQQLIERQVRHLARFIEDLVDVSRLTRGKLELRRERVDIRALLESALAAVRAQPNCRALRLGFEVPEGPVEVDGDPVRLQQVFESLLNNACRFTDGEGEVHLGVEDAGGDVIVRVRDTGTGIAAEDLPQIFEPFVQVGHSLENPASGLGIGLSLARGLVELHGGRISARSAGLGAGAEFLVALPLAEGPEGAEPPPPARRAARQPARRRILVVDDQPDVVESLAMLLEASGHEVVTAGDGIEGIAAAERHRPDVVFLDIGMPRLDGYGACRRIRAAPWGRGMQLIALSGWGHDVDRRRSAEAGFDRHLVKPVSAPDVMQVLDGSVPEHRAWNESSPARPQH